MTPETFQQMMAPIFECTAENDIGSDLEAQLNERHPAGGDFFMALEAACRDAIDAGWMCAQGSDGRRFGRVIEATPQTHNLSVDVVQLTDIVGPHHIHPTGEVCLVMPQTPGALFDGQGAGWCVNPPGSDHFPTVTDGEALVLYLLPGGEIDFTGKKPPAA